jgi:DNA-binding winged helix-turn-helix (wHTH) protein/tetratricopeptide (TPR) repeat protein
MSHAEIPGLVIGEVAVDLEARELTRGEQRLLLTPLEASLLAYLASQDGRVVSREELQQEVWGYRPGIRTRAVDSTVLRLRKKIEDDPDNAQHLISVYGAGYRLVLPEPPELAAPPEPETPFIGRVAELATLETLLEPPGQLALRGLPGVGKSRLAAALAARWIARGRRAIWLDASKTPDEQALVHRLCQALDLPPEGFRDARALESVLESGQRPLLVIDGSPPECWLRSEQGWRWITGLDGVTALLTCRGGALLCPAWEVPPLSGEDALALLESRSGRSPGAGDEAWRARLAPLLPHLGGLPFVIERAATQLAGGTPEQLLAQLEARTTPLFTRSMEEVLEEALEALGAPERAALIGCASFAGPFTPEDAEALLPGDDVTGHLLSLVRGAWLRREYAPSGALRLAMDPPVRRWLRRRDPAALEATDQAHRRYFLESAEQRTGRLSRTWNDEDATWLRECAPELLACWERSLPGDPLTAARAALMLHFYPMSPIEPLPVASARLARTREALPDDAPRKLVGELHLLESVACRRLGQDNRPHIEAALAIGQALEDPWLIGATLGELGTGALERGDLEQVQEHLERAVAMLERSERPSNAASFINNLGGYYRRKARPREAEVCYLAALERAGERVSPSLRAVSWGNLAGLLIDRGEVREAERYNAKAEASFREAGDWVFLARVQNNRAVGLMLLGELRQAREVLNEAAAAVAGSGLVRVEALVRRSVGTLEILCGDDGAALAALGQAREATERIGDAHQVGLARWYLALAHLQAGRFDAAAEQLELTLARLGGQREWTEELGVPCALAIARGEQGRPEEARALLAGAAEGPMGRLAGGWLGLLGGDPAALADAVAGTRAAAKANIDVLLFWRIARARAERLGALIRL